MRTLDDIMKEIVDLNGQDDKAAFEKFLEAASIGRDSGNDTVHVMGIMNAAAIVCKIGQYDLCMELLTRAHDVNEEIWTKYFEKPHMYEMMKKLSEAGVLKKGA